MSSNTLKTEGTLATLRAQANAAYSAVGGFAGARAATSLHPHGALGWTSAVAVFGGISCAVNCTPLLLQLSEPARHSIWEWLLCH